MSDGTIRQNTRVGVVVEKALSELRYDGRTKLEVPFARRILEDYEDFGAKSAASRSGVTESTVTRLVCLVREQIDGDSGRYLVPSTPSHSARLNRDHAELADYPFADTATAPQDVYDDPWAARAVIAEALNEVPPTAPGPFVGADPWAPQQDLDYEVVTETPIAVHSHLGDEYAGDDLLSPNSSDVPAPYVGVDAHVGYTTEVGTAQPDSYLFCDDDKDYCVNDDYTAPKTHAPLPLVALAATVIGATLGVLGTRYWRGAPQ